MAMYTKVPEIILSGSVSISAAGNAITGVGTTFLSQLKVGGFIAVDGQFFQIVAIASNTSMTVKPVAAGAVVGKIASTRPLPGTLSPEYAKHVRYYSNADISKPSIRALGIKTPGWVYHKTYTTATGSVRNIVEPVISINDRFIDVRDKANIIIIGASLSDYSFSTANGGSPNAQLIAARDALATSLGFRGQIHSRAVAGSVLTSILTQAIAAKAEFASTQGNNLYVLPDFGGNDVTARRPYVEADDYNHFYTLINQIFDVVSAGDDEIVMMPLSKRLYPTGATVSAGQIDANGSLPYITNVYYPTFAELKSKWLVGPTEHYIDFYEWTERHELEFLRVDDGVHPHSGSFQGMQAFVFAGLLRGSKRITNSPTLRRGKSYMIVPTANGFFFESNNNINFFRTGPQALDEQGKSVGGALRDLVSGEHDLFMEYSCRGFVGLNTAGAGATAVIAGDARFNANTNATGHIMSRSIFMDSSNLSNTAIVSIRNLVPGETGRVTLAASRAAADNTRQANVAINGTNIGVLNAANNAANNLISNTFVVSANGTLEISILRNVTGNTAYLSGLIVDFD